MNIETLQLYRTAARVERCHNVPPLHRQTVGEHTFGMLGILRLVKPEASKVLLLSVIDHDVPEAVTGDIPSPMLHTYSELSRGDKAAASDVISKHKLFDPSEDLTPDEYKVYKFCDRMELALFAIEEADSGNIKMLRLYYTVMRSIEKDNLIEITPEATQLYEYAKVYVERYYGDMHERLDFMFHGTANK